MFQNIASPSARSRQLWRRTGNFFKTFLQFYVDDFRFKAAGLTTFSDEFWTLTVYLTKKTPNLVAKILATKFGFVPDWLWVSVVWYMSYSDWLVKSRICSSYTSWASPDKNTALAWRAYMLLAWENLICMYVIMYDIGSQNIQYLLRLSALTAQLHVLPYPWSQSLSGQFSKWLQIFMMSISIVFEDTWNNFAFDEHRKCPHCTRLTFSLKKIKVKDNFDVFLITLIKKKTVWYKNKDVSQILVSDFGVFLVIHVY